MRWKDTVVVQFKEILLCRNFPGGTEENHEKSQSEYVGRI